MAHVRIRKFNTKDVYPNQTLDNDVCMVVRAGRQVFLRGQTGMDFDGKVHGINDAAAQAENAMRAPRSCSKRRAAASTMSAR
jgi:enamine deaminase RidA (YjgF/YER057c/UK114 family)